MCYVVYKMLTKQNFYDYDFRIDGWAGWQWAKSMFPSIKYFSETLATSQPG